MRKVDEVDGDRLLERLLVAAAAVGSEEAADGGAVVHEEDGAGVGQVLSLPSACVCQSVTWRPWIIGRGISGSRLARIRGVAVSFFSGVGIRIIAMIKYPILESISVWYKNRFWLELELDLESESSNSEKCSKSDSGMDSSPGIITPLVRIQHPTPIHYDRTLYAA